MPKKIEVEIDDIESVITFIQAGVEPRKIVNYINAYILNNKTT